MNVAGAQLAQKTGNLTTATSALAGLSLNCEIELIVVQVDQNCNCTIYHDDDGTTYTLATQVWYEARTVALNKEAVWAAQTPLGLVLRVGGSIGVKCSVDAAATFTIYGQIAEAR
jgi:hypothetical protein